MISHCIGFVLNLNCLNKVKLMLKFLLPRLLTCQIFCQRVMLFAQFINGFVLLLFER